MSFFPAESVPFTVAVCSDENPVELSASGRRNGFCRPVVALVVLIAGWWG